MRILIVEDDNDVATSLYEFLEKCGYIVDAAADGVTGLHLATVGTFDAIVLDVALPGLDGLELSRQLREVARKTTPVLMLTARDALSDKLAGFESGADDYLVKPFALAELDARLRALVKRSSGRLGARELRVRDLCLNLDTMEVTARANADCSQTNRTADSGAADARVASGGTTTGDRESALGRRSARQRRPAGPHSHAAQSHRQTLCGSLAAYHAGYRLPAQPPFSR